MYRAMELAALLMCVFSGTALCQNIQVIQGYNVTTTDRNGLVGDQDSLLTPYHGVFCSKELDIMLMMDASSSIGDVTFKKVKQFMGMFVQRFAVNRNAARFGAIRYNKYSWVDFNLNTFSRRWQIQFAIYRMSGVVIGSRNGHAFKIARTQAFQSENGDRADVPNVVVLITDGRSSFPDWTKKEANLLKDTGAKVFVVGMGGKIDVDELTFISSGPSYTFVVRDGDSLRPILADLVNAVCDDGAPKEPEPEICYLADVALVVDASSSIGPSKLDRLKTFIQDDLLPHFDIGRERVHVAVVKFNRFAQTIFTLDTYTTREEVSNAVAAVDGTVIGTRTGHAMKIVREEVFIKANGDRPGAPNVVILLTDGRSSYPEWTFEEAAKLKSAGVKIFAIGFGRIDPEELRLTASSPESVYVHDGDGFHGLQPILNEFVIVPCDETCALADVALVIDASSSIGPGDLERLKTFLQDLLRHFDIGSDKVNVAMVKYNKFAKTLFSLNTYKTRKEVSDAIAAVEGTAIGTRTAHAMKIVREEVFIEANGDRPNAPNVVILVTDGRSSYPEWTFEEAELLKNADVSIFAIGIGRIDADELKQTATNPESVYVHYVDNFQGLTQILNEFAGSVCHGTHRT